MDKKPTTTTEPSIPIPIPDTSDLEKLRVEPDSFGKFEAEARELILHAADCSGIINKVAALLSRGVAGTTVPWLIDKFDEIVIPSSFAECANGIWTATARMATEPATDDCTRICRVSGVAPNPLLRDEIQNSMAKQPPRTLSLIWVHHRRARGKWA